MTEHKCPASGTVILTGECCTALHSHVVMFGWGAESQCDHEFVVRFMDGAEYRHVMNHEEYLALHDVLVGPFQRQAGLLCDVPALVQQIVSMVDCGNSGELSEVIKAWVKQHLFPEATIPESAH
jgi:hypothetical protein